VVIQGTGLKDLKVILDVFDVHLISTLFINPAPNAKLTKLDNVGGLHWNYLPFYCSNFLLSADFKIIYVLVAYILHLTDSCPFS